MVVWRAGTLLVVAAMGLAACSAGTDESTAPTVTTPAAPTVPAPTTAPPTTAPLTAAPSTSAPPTTSAPAGPNPECIVVVEPGDSLGLIAGDADVAIDDLRTENRLRETTVIHPGDEIDVCIDNGVDDVTGASREPPSAAAVMRQQERLNELFADTSLPELLVDGVSGPLTRQALCAARLALDLRADTVDMSEGSPEEVALFEATALTIPDGAATWADRWILIDKTCQVVFTGEADRRVVDIFPTSTGEAGFETHDVQANPAFRYDPALDNDGWHDSASFPVEVDNPLNGNMYKPLYFNNGQAIHGAGYVPPEPRSKGCARLFPWHQDRLLSWLGLDDITEATWSTSRLNVTVTAQGDFRPSE